MGGGGTAGSASSPAPMLGRVATDEVNEALPTQLRLELDEFNGMPGDKVVDDA
jgi:hypothetical protein